MTKLPPICFPSFMSSLFPGQKKFFLSRIAVTVMASFVFLPFLRSALPQLANCQIRKRASELGHQIEFYSLLIEDGGGGWDRLSERASGPPPVTTVGDGDGHFRVGLNVCLSGQQGSWMDRLPKEGDRERETPAFVGHCSHAGLACFSTAWICRVC